MLQRQELCAGVPSGCASNPRLPVWQLLWWAPTTTVLGGLQVEAEVADEVTVKYEVSTVPFFVFIKVAGQLLGACRPRRSRRCSPHLGPAPMRFAAPAAGLCMHVQVRRHAGVLVGRLAQFLHTGQSRRWHGSAAHGCIHACVPCTHARTHAATWRSTHSDARAPCMCVRVCTYLPTYLPMCWRCRVAL